MVLLVGCAEPPDDSTATPNTTVPSGAAPTAPNLDDQIAVLVAETADLRAAVADAEQTYAALAEHVEQSRTEAEAALDALVTESAGVADTSELTREQLEERAYAADPAFKQRAQSVIESALQADLAQQRRLATAASELDAMRTALAEKEAALAALAEPAR